MTFKEYLVLQLHTYCFLVTAIFAISMIFGVVFTPDEQIYYYQLIGPFILAALCVIPSFVTFFKDEPTVKQFVFRHIIQFVMIEAIVLFFINPPENGNKLVYKLIIAGSVLVIYVLSKLMIMLKQYYQSKQLTKQLRVLQDSV